MKNISAHYFLGCSSPEGFASFFSEICQSDSSWKTYIIKGGAGTGKSSIMKKIASELEKRGFVADRVHCSSDPASLDGVICRELNFSIADGTSPHVLEPLFPGAIENIINLGENWDKNILREKSGEIISLTNRNALCHQRCTRFLCAAGKVRYDTQRLCEEAVIEYKIHCYADRFSRRRFRRISEKRGEERRIFLSAVTPRGIVFFPETLRHYASEIILVDDPTVIASGMLLEELKNLALKNGYDVISCFCPLQPYAAPEHIIIPSLSLAFTRYHDEYPLSDKTRIIHCARFLDKEKLAKHKNRLSFNKKITSELISEAVSSLKEAKRIHDETEKIYISSMDFSSSDNTVQQILSDIV